MSPTMTRRRLLAGAVGAAGATALAACGETQIVERVVTKEVIKEVPVEKIVMQTQIKEVPVDRVVTQIVEKVVEASAQARPVTFDFNSDHVSGPRGKSLQWAIGAYAQLRPMTRIRFRPQADWREKVNIQAVAGTLAEISLLSDSTFQQLPGPLPYNDMMRGPQYGMPYQGAGIAGLMYNIDLLEGAGVPEPQDGWDFDDLLEGAMKIRNPEAGVWGLRSIILSMQHTCWGYNGLQKYIIGPEGHLVLGNFQGAGRDALERVWDYTYTYEVQFPPELRQEIGGEYGSPFNAGLQGFDHGMGRSTGFSLSTIGDRFRWAQAPQPRGPHPTSTGDNEYVDQPHLVSSNAAKNGVAEEVVDFAIYMAGPEVQARNGIDRGFYPCRRGLQNSPESIAPPPERMEELYLIYEKCLMRPGGSYIPGSPLGRGEVEGMWVRPIQKLFAGDISIDEAVEIAERDVSAQMAKYKADFDSGRESR